MTLPVFCGTIQYMKIVAIVAILGVSSSFAEAGQARRAPQRPAAPSTAAPASRQDDRVGQAYEQFLRARAIRDDDVEGAIAAYKRAMTLDPAAADIPADLADLYMDEGPDVGSHCDRRAGAENHARKLRGPSRPRHGVRADGDQFAKRTPWERGPAGRCDAQCDFTSRAIDRESADVRRLHDARGADALVCGVGKIRQSDRDPARAHQDRLARRRTAPDGGVRWCRPDLRRYQVARGCSAR